MMAVQARYVHTNLIAGDWRALASLYQTVFGCIPVPSERDYRGPVLDAGTGLMGTPLAGPEDNMIELQAWAPAGPQMKE